MKTISAIVNILVLFVMFSDDLNRFYKFCLKCHVSLVDKVPELMFQEKYSTDKMYTIFNFSNLERFPLVEYH